MSVLVIWFDINRVMENVDTEVLSSSNDPKGVARGQCRPLSPVDVEVETVS